jgi:hypothetical protein
MKNSEGDFDIVTKPKHYNTGKIEVLDFIEDQRLDFHEANVVKYVCRARYKGSEITDLEKAAVYLGRKIKLLKERT